MWLYATVCVTDNQKSDLPEPQSLPEVCSTHSAERWMHVLWNSSGANPSNGMESTQADENDNSNAATSEPTHSHVVSSNNNASNDLAAAHPEGTRRSELGNHQTASTSTYEEGNQRSYEDEENAWNSWCNKIFPRAFNQCIPEYCPSNVSQAIRSPRENFNKFLSPWEKDLMLH